MSTGSFGGAGTSVIGFTDQWVHSAGIPLPVGRNTMFDGATRCLIVSLGAYVAGRGASRTIVLSFESYGSTSGFSMASGGSAVDTLAQACGFLVNGGTDTFRITGNGSFYFGRGTSTGAGPTTDSHGTTFSNVLGGYYTYLSSPTAPLTPAVTAPTTTSAAVTWAAPSDNGDSAVSGYRLDYSTSVTFATAVTSVEVGNVLAYTVSGLTASTQYYFRVFAENLVTQVAGSWSQPTATVTLTAGAGGGTPSATFAMQANVTTASTYPTSSVGYWSFWMTQSPTSWFFAVTIAGTFGGTKLQFGVDPTVGFWASTTTNPNPIGDGPTYLPAQGYPNTHRFSVGVGASFSAGTWKFPLTLYVDGVLVSSATSTTNTPPATFPNTARQPTLVQVGTLGTVGTATISRLEHTLMLAHEEYATQPTEAGYLSAAAAATSQVTLGTLPTDLSTAPVGYLVSSGQTTLDSLNLIARTEQASIDCVTTGTYLNPVQTVRVRSRQRPVAVGYQFDGQQEVSEFINFVRDSTNLIWSDVVTGTNSSTLTVSQLALQTRAGSNNSADTVATYRQSDLYEYGSDRLWRGQNVALRPVAVVINNQVAPNDRSSDLLNMVPGDRIQITNIPSTVLGFTTWDGWLLDKQQSHKVGPNGEDKFTLYLQPVQPATGIFDTNLFMSGGVHTLNAALTNVAPTTTILSADPVTYLETVATPYTLLIDTEQVTVTACGAPTAGVQTVTITRGVNSTTAAAHLAGAAVEVAAASLYAY